MGKEQQMMQSLLDGNDYLIEQGIKNAPFDKCSVGLITQVNDDNTYSVKIGDEIYTNIPSLNFGLVINDTVKVLSPQNQFNQFFILGKYNMELNNTITYYSDGVKLPLKVELGTAILSGASDVVRRQTLQFKTSFSFPPRIFVSDATSDPSHQYTSVYPYSVTNFTLNTIRKDASEAEVFWVAIGS